MLLTISKDLKLSMKRQNVLRTEDIIDKHGLASA